MKGVQLATIVVALLHVTTADISHMPAQQGIQEIQQAEVNVKEREADAIPPALLRMTTELQRQLAQTNALKFPFLPMIATSGVSLSLTNVQLLGLADTELIKNYVELVKKVITIPLKMPSISLLSDPYIAGGMINNMPFVGESSMSIEIIDMYVTLSYERKPPLSFCVIANSTVFDIDISRLKVNFNELNPGTDTGDLINAIISSLAKDIGEALTLLLNDDEALHPMADKLVGGIINKILTESGIGNCSENPAQKNEFVADLDYLKKINQAFKLIEQKMIIQN